MAAPTEPERRAGRERGNRREGRGHLILRSEVHGELGSAAVVVPAPRSALVLAPVVFVALVFVALVFVALVVVIV
ncbi:hypothetical protein GCM10010483_58560 [Actinokineospora diospyrosa]